MNAREEELAERAEWLLLSDIDDDIKEVIAFFYGHWKAEQIDPLNILQLWEEYKREYKGRELQ